MKTHPQNPAQELFLEFCDAYKKRDLQQVMSMFTDNSNMWGTGLDEYRVGLKQIEAQVKRDWSQSQHGEISVISFVPTAKDASWAAGLCRVKLMIDGKEHYFDDFRGTISVEKVDGAWKIAHMHASFPDYRNAEQGSFPVK